MKKNKSVNNSDNTLTLNTFKKELEKELKKELKNYATKDDLKKELKSALKKYATKDDLQKALSNYPTKDDLQKALSNYSTKIQTEMMFDKFEYKMDEKAKQYRNEILTKMDQVIGELAQIREDRIFEKHEYISFRNKINNHEKRITNLETQKN